MNSKENKGVFVIYDGCMKSGEFFNPDLLPRYNGKGIEGIWCPCDFAKDPKVVDACGWSFEAPNSFTDVKEINRFGFLPESWKGLFGPQIIQGKKVFVKHISFRTSSSGHASWDSIMTIYCNDNQLSVWYDRTGKEKGLNQNDAYVKRWLVLFNKNVPYVHPKEYNWQWQPLYPKLDVNEGTYIQQADGEFFPDVYCKPWRDYGTHAYKLLNPNQLTILNEDTKEIYRLYKEGEPKEGDCNMILIRDYKPYFLYPMQNNKGDFIRVTLEKIATKYIYVNINGKTEQMDRAYLKYFWNIFSINKVKKIKTFGR